MILRFLLWAIFAYFIYKLIFNFLLPIIKVSAQLKKQMKDFQKASMQQQDTMNSQTGSTSKQTARPAGDYIDFEEIKN